MKKLLSFAIVFLMIMSTMACSKEENDGFSGAGKGTVSDNSQESTVSAADNDGYSVSDSGNVSEAVSKDNDSPTGDNGSAASDTASQERPERNTGNNRNSMEKKIASYLSEIGGPEEISICDGKTFTYEPWSEWSLWGDSWTISQPDISDKQTFIDSLDKQLVENCGFKKTSDIMGPVYYVNAGVNQLGIRVTYYLDFDYPEDNEVTIYMTHSPECYSMAYIDEMKACMPKIIAFQDVRERLPENYQITFMQGTYERTVAAKDGDLFVAEIDRDPNGWNNTGLSYAYINNGDGTFTELMGSGYMGDNLSTSGVMSAEEVESRVQYYYDLSGESEYGSLATWGQISTEYENDSKDYFDQPCRYFDFSTSMVTTEAETVAGVLCDTCMNDNIWTKLSYAFDPTTGVTFKIIKTESGSDPETIFEVLEYNTNPESLGSYKK